MLVGRGPFLTLFEYRSHPMADGLGQSANEVGPH